MKYVRTDAIGLAIPPRDLDCVGEGLCAYLETERGCYSSGHHIYFEEERFRQHSELAWEFRNDPNNIWSLARCQEDRIHSRFDGARVPTNFIMELFLNESQMLQDLGVLSRKVLSTDKNLEKHVCIAEAIEHEEKVRGRNTLTPEYWNKVRGTAEHNEIFRRLQRKRAASFGGYSAITLHILQANPRNKHLLHLLETAA